MTMTTRKNPTVKALQTEVNFQRKIGNFGAELEYELAFSTSPKLAWSQEKTKQHYDRYGQTNGATKCCHLKNHKGGRFQYIVVKRFLQNGWDGCNSNQLNSEIAAWQKWAERPEADFLNPIIKFFTSKSDKVTECSETMKDNVIIIAQRAEKVSHCKECCRMAEEMNRRNGYQGTDAETRYEQLKRFSQSQGWWDAMRNPGNSGVIFDYSQKCYKAVFIDYAL